MAPCSHILDKVPEPIIGFLDLTNWSTLCKVKSEKEVSYCQLPESTETDAGIAAAMGAVA